MNININDQIAIIKTKMPQTYAAIQAREKGVTKEVDGKTVVVMPAYGTGVYALVKRGLRGDPNCFWAIERGHVMGTPFNQPDVMLGIAQYMVAFGCAHVCIFAQPSQEHANGAA